MLTVALKAAMISCSILGSYIVIEDIKENFIEPLLDHRRERKINKVMNIINAKQTKEME